MMPEHAPPVFVGGTGRSGTTIAGQLIGEHPSYAFIPMELKFHVHTSGLAGLLEGTCTMDDFLAYMRGEWLAKTQKWSAGDYMRRWSRTRGAEFPEGSVLIDITAEDVELMLESFVADYERDPVAACRTMIDDLVYPFVAAVGKSSWVETTPVNGKSATTLHRLYPDMRFVHMLRDGRDVASSRLTRTRIAARRAAINSGFKEELRWWAKRVRLTDTALKKLPPEHMLTVQFEELTRLAREETFDRIAEFLGPGDTSAMARFFAEGMAPERAHIGRWRRSDDVDEAAIDKEYARLIDQLEADGVAGIAGLRHVMAADQPA